MWSSRKPSLGNALRRARHLLLVQSLSSLAKSLPHALKSSPDRLQAAAFTCCRGHRLKTKAIFDGGVGFMVGVNWLDESWDVVSVWMVYTEKGLAYERCCWTS